MLNYNGRPRIWRPVAQKQVRGIVFRVYSYIKQEADAGQPICYVTKYSNALLKIVPM
jgi:hypothetical protein